MQAYAQPCKRSSERLLRILSRVTRTVSVMSSLIKSGFPLRGIIRGGALLRSIRYNSSEPSHVFTKLSDEKDPHREAFFKYTWGSWLQNDKTEKAKRMTRFSIEGANTLFESLYEYSLKSAKSGGIISNPVKAEQNVVILPHNVDVKAIGLVNPNQSIAVTQMSSIHEGKHHRIYRIETNSSRSFVLRIPYNLESEAARSLRIKSEVATMDFCREKLGIKVPKVYAFSADSTNPLKCPFILMEHLEGDLMMRQWNPLASDEDAQSLKQVIDPMADFEEKLLSVEFNQFGSLFFKQDVDAQLQQKGEPYEGETRKELKDRWRIGPTVERQFYRNKNGLKSSQIAEKTGPWPQEKPLQMISDLAELEVENLKSELSLLNADSSAKAVSEKPKMESAIRVFEKLSAIAPALFNTSSQSVPNIASLFKPRLYEPNLDPMNVVLVQEIPHLLDLENACIKPFILQSYPSFVAYEGPKIFNLEEEVEGYKELDEVEQQQYQFMYKRTRNQFQWEVALNNKRKDLLGAIAPAIKLLRSPYTSALENKSVKDYLYVEACLINLQQLWSSYYGHGLVSCEEMPNGFTKQEIETNAKELEQYHAEITSTPFAATKGWVPQDMFVNLKKQGIIVEDGEDHKIDTEKVLS